MPTPTIDHTGEVTVTYKGQQVTATFASWNQEYPGYANVVYNGHKLIRRVTEARVSTATINDDSAEIVTFPINERFEFINELTTQVVSGFSNGLIITGSGGLGKTFTVMTCLKGNDLGSEDYVVIKGHATALSLYNVLYENCDKIIVFDDCDSVLEDKTAVNILKAAIDTDGKRMVTWLTSRDNAVNTNMFEFTGRIIFISNKSLDKIPQPLLSRCLFVDVTMTTDEKIERISSIIKDICPDLSICEKTSVLDLIKKHSKIIKDLNVRTFIKTCSVYQAQKNSGAANWKRLAIYLLTNCSTDNE